MHERLQCILRCYAADLKNDERGVEHLLSKVPLEDEQTWKLVSGHGLLPSLYLLASRHVPSRIRPSTATEFEAQSKRSITYAREVPRIVAQLAHCGIESIPFKGRCWPNQRMGTSWLEIPTISTCSFNRTDGIKPSMDLRSWAIDRRTGAVRELRYVIADAALTTT